MAKKTGARETIRMKSTASPHMYSMTKNKRNDPDRLQLKRYDPVVRKHVIYKEAR